jgi:hypothetical protein
MFDFLKNAAVKRLASSAIRHGLTALGAYLVAQGYTTETDWASIALDASPLIVALVWSVIEKAADGKKLADASPTE